MEDDKEKQGDEVGDCPSDGDIDNLTTSTPEHPDASASSCDDDDLFDDCADTLPSDVEDEVREVDLNLSSSADPAPHANQPDNHQEIITDEHPSSRKQQAPPDDSTTVQMHTLRHEEADEVRWLLYKRVFVTHAYDVAFSKLCTSQCICLFIGIASCLYSSLGFVQGVCMCGLAVPLAFISFSRTVFLWKYIASCGHEIQHGVYEYWMEQPQRALFVASLGKVALGTAAVAQVADSTVEISRVCTVRECRQQGLAQAIIAHVLKVCAMSGVTRCLLVVSETNVPAFELFSKMGFVPIGKRQRSLCGLAWTDVTMELQIHHERASEISSGERRPIEA